MTVAGVNYFPGLNEMSSCTGRVVFETNGTGFVVWLAGVRIIGWVGQLVDLREMHGKEQVTALDGGCEAGFGL